MNDLSVFEAWLKKQYQSLDLGLDRDRDSEQLKLNVDKAVAFHASLELLREFRSSIINF